jgi:hypothetical protein
MNISARTILGALAAWGWLAVVPRPAAATAPPDMPLPECIYVAGQPAGGPCPALSLHVSGNASGRLGAGATVVVNTVPAVPVCDYWNAYSKEWRPSGCYAEVGAPTIVNCGYIDLGTEAHTWREAPCTQALYKSTTGLPNLFTFRRPAGSEDPRSGSIVCGAVPNYNTYIYGGAGNNEAAVWRTRGPAALKCGITFNGPRPDGMRGPTWAKVRVRVNYAETPNLANGSQTFSEFYVPIDGDMRDVADMDVAASGSITEANWDGGRLFARYNVTVTNSGDLAAENTVLTVRFPKVMVYLGATDDACAKPVTGNTMVPGGVITCSWPSFEGHGTRSFAMDVRITNATDLDAIQRAELLESYRDDRSGVLFQMSANNDTNADNNEALAQVDIPFRSGSYAQTRALMEALAPHFDYQTDKKFKTCNVYKDDIAERLTALHEQHPEVFANLSWGRVTSGQYLIAGQDSPWTRAGHVGVVVYEKGTHFRQTGIVINGTPSPSPLNTVSEIGPSDPGGGMGLGGWTGLHGQYLRTPANEFPGKVQREGNRNDGFEGLYPTNATEFVHGGGAYTPPAADPSVSCPIGPEAAVVGTNSPVELIITNSRGQEIRTEAGNIVAQELDGGIFSMAFPHEDGTYAWTIVLPKDDYDIQVVGVATGPYQLIRTTFDEDGNPVDEVTNGSTSLGQTDEYTLEAAEPEPPVTPEPPGGGGGGGSIPKPRSGGGGAIDPSILFGLLLMFGWQLRRARVRAR